MFTSRKLNFPVPRRWELGNRLGLFFFSFLILSYSFYYRGMWGIIEYFFQSRIKAKLFPQCKSIAYYTGKEISCDDIRKRLTQSAGGSVELKQNEETGIATICLNHPEKRNAISGKMMVELESAVSALEKWKSGKGVIIHGAQHNFCSGGDLNMARMFSNPDDGFRMATLMQRVLYQLESLPLITVALIEGSGAIGGGSEIAVACDFRLLTTTCGGIAFVHSRMGIAPAWGGCTRLVHLIGYRRALDMMTTGCRVRGEEALSIGLADAIVNADNALQEASEWLKLRIKSEPQVVKAIKMMAHNAKVMSYQDSLQEERRIFAPLWGGSANQAALSQNIKHK